MFMPLRLGEVLTQRAFTKTDDLNGIARSMQKQEQRVGFDLSRADEVSFLVKDQVVDPRGQWAIIDGIEAVKWIYVLAGYIDEQDFRALEDHFVTLVRKHPLALEQVKLKWDETMWTIAIEMRRGKSLKQMIDQVLADFKFELKQSKMIDEAEAAKGGTKGGRKSSQGGVRGVQVEPSRPRSRSPRRFRTMPNSKGKQAWMDKAKTKGWLDGKEVEYCRLWNNGGCKAKCPGGRIHRCAICDNSSHRAHKCE